MVTKNGKKIRNMNRLFKEMNSVFPPILIEILVEHWDE